MYRLLKPVYVPNPKHLPYLYPADMEKILAYLKEHGTLQIPEPHIEAWYLEFSEKQSAGWLNVNEETLAEFAEWLSEQRVEV